MKPITDARGKLINFAVTIKLNGLLGGVEHDLAVMALGYMLFDFNQKTGIDLTVKVIR
jgi:hypothetical protein